MAQYVLMYSYKIFRLIIIAIIIIYFTGCAWYLLSTTMNVSEDDINSSFVTTYFESKNITNNSDRLIATCYYAIVTLTTAGYGDFYP